MSALEDFSPVHRLVMEVRIYLALKQLAEEVGDDQTGAEDYQWTRLQEALDAVEVTK